MDAFVRKFCEKYSLPITVSLQLLEKMEKFSFRKGDFLVQEGERNSNFYIISKGIWRGHYLNDGADVSVWFASEGEAVFSSWGYIENTPSLVSIEAMCDSELYGISKAKLESFYASSAELANFGRRLFRTATSRFGELAYQRRESSCQRALSCFVGRESRTFAICSVEAYCFLSVDYSAVIEPHPCRTGKAEKDKRLIR